MPARISTAVTLFLSLFSVAAIAEPDQSVPVPEKVSASILKRHPHAQELQASRESHFGVQLLEVRFKTDTDEPIQELFTLSGHLFTRELPMIGLSELTPAAMETLQQLPHYQLKKAERIANPNGAGEEYELLLHMDGADWKIVIDDKGKLVQKQSLY